MEETDDSFKKYLKKSSASLYRHLKSLPQRNYKVVAQAFSVKHTPPLHPFIQQVKQAQRLMEEKLATVKESINRKMEYKHMHNDEIVKECQTLDIKHIGKKFSEYKIKSGFEKMKQKLEVQRMARNRKPLSQSQHHRSNQHPYNNANPDEVSQTSKGDNVKWTASSVFAPSKSQYRNLTPNCQLQDEQHRYKCEDLKISVFQKVEAPGQAEFVAFENSVKVSPKIKVIMQYVRKNTKFAQTNNLVLR